MGIPTIKDRLMQKCLEQLLTPYFENIFSEWSFGFRIRKSYHDAIKRVKQRFKGIDYIVKIDLKGYFDTINHKILMRTLNQFIKKNKTLSTINKWLKAGFMKDGNQIRIFIRFSSRRDYFPSDSECIFTLH
ncbi:MAG: reverse transcriptase domain-containing protein ['Waltheria sp.' little leaf phytoplasma]|nr:reverse transcriptase domain-containing protein ['Waltheria sp.' little leaf phytoplasma]